MTPGEFLANIGTISDAPNGTKKLRELVLELAARGLLEKQIPTDEPASVLLHKIALDKAKLSSRPRQKTIQPEKELNVAPPFDVPSSWQWARFDELTYRVEYGTSAKPTTDPSGFILLRMNNLQDGRVVLDSIKYTPKTTDGIDSLMLEHGDILFNRTNSYELVGKTAVFLEQHGRHTFASYLIRATLLAGTDSARFVNFYFSTPTFRATQLAPGIVQQNGQANFNGSKLRSVWVPVPPLAEQKRIVAKVDQLMALCDELERQQAKKQETGARLTRSTLDALTSAEGPEEFAEAWQRVTDNFEVLLNKPKSVGEIRKAILRLATRGKLVRQEPDEAPASETLQLVKERRLRLLAEKKAGRPENLTNVAPEETPYSAPPGWLWTRLANITICRDGQRIPVSKEERQKRRGHYDYYGASGVIDTIDSYLFDEPLLLVGEDGANLLNRSTPIAFIATGKYWVNNHAHVLDGANLDSLRYLAVFINAIDLEPYVTGTAQPKMNQAKMNSIPVALPPLGEQKRIVAKVDQLMALCDELESKLRDAEQGAQRLAEAMTAAMVA